MATLHSGSNTCKGPKISCQPWGCNRTPYPLRDSSIQRYGQQRVTPRQRHCSSSDGLERDHLQRPSPEELRPLVTRASRFQRSGLFSLQCSCSQADRTSLSSSP
ncbi:Hypothetical predicted protein [Pelobates cultripes]|uniref:Uncharacterized protein n=1 Tax=Pelobates cultripes TaxID=61616 RepID=A0AAD1RUB7_PELCU|nr:Hypothetical predicted protein [Pelobates cultripes]